MKTATPPVRAARTDGARIELEDGRVLIDGMSSWWTACHGYNHPHIRAAVAEQLELMPHVMFGGLSTRPPNASPRGLRPLRRAIWTMCSFRILARSASRSP
jgi:adenosylmethionine-8-amino-7-oxononanoate aminotransferase